MVIDVATLRGIHTHSDGKVHNKTLFSAQPVGLATALLYTALTQSEKGAVVGSAGRENGSFKILQCCRFPGF